MEAEKEKNLLKTEPYITTVSGKKFFIRHPERSEICIEDIAHALSNVCRFAGHTKHFYSVAQHAILVSDLCGMTEIERFRGLNHDNSEAYICDLPSPYKNLTELGAHYKKFEDAVTDSINKAIGIDTCMTETVKWADRTALLVEKRQLLPKEVVWSWENDWIDKYQLPEVEIVPMTPEESEQKFLENFYSLSKLL